jgi:hypothetical protein
MTALHTQGVMKLYQHWREARVCSLASRYAKASSSALASRRSTVSKPSVNEP